MSNPLLHIERLTSIFSNQTRTYSTGIQELIEENRQAIEQVLKQPHFTWETLLNRFLKQANT